MSEYKIFRIQVTVKINGEYFCGKDELKIEKISNFIMCEVTHNYTLKEWDKFIKEACEKTRAFTKQCCFGKDEIIYNNLLQTRSVRKSHFQNAEISYNYKEADDLSISEILNKFGHKTALAYLSQELKRLKENEDE